MADKVKIRMARPTEATAVYRILMEAYAPYEGKIFPPFAVFQTGPSAIASHIRARRHKYALAFTGRKPVGTLRCTPVRNERGPTYWVLSRLAVLPSHQGKGVAADLIRWMHDLARKSGVRELRGDVRTALPALLRFYERFGYTVCGYRSKPGYPRYLAVVRTSLRDL